MGVREKLVELLAKYFAIGDSYAYNLTRVKEAFAIGAVTIDDFVEFDDEVIADIADHLIANGVTVSEGALPVADAATERSAAVDKIEGQRKPEDFIGHRKPEQEWISVKDRLPENDQLALCFMKDNSFGTFRVLQWDYIDWQWNDGNEWFDEKDVTHWMPLPQPPKGE